MTSEERRELRNAFADYVASEGCSCCQDTGRHAARLGKLLKVRRYPDDSGYDFYHYKTARPGETP